MEFGLTLRNYASRILEDLRTAEKKIGAVIAELKKSESNQIKDVVPNLELNLGGIKEAVSALEAIMHDFPAVSRATAMHFLNFLAQSLNHRYINLFQRFSELRSAGDEAAKNAAGQALEALLKIEWLRSEIDNMSRDMRQK